jgi:hypothetical protein
MVQLGRRFETLESEFAFSNFVMVHFISE